MRLSVIVPTLTGEVPAGVSALGDAVELIAVKGVTPVSVARNEGLVRATGDYVAWVDADDEISPEWLAEILKALNDHPDLVSFDAHAEWTDASRPGYDLRLPFADGPVDPERFHHAYCRGTIGGQLWGRVFRRELFAGLTFVGAQYEELAVLHALLERVKSIRHVAKSLYVYRRTATGLSQCRGGSDDIERVVAYAEAHPETQLAVCQMAIDFLRHASPHPPRVVSFVRRTLAPLLFARDLPFAVKVKGALAACGL